MQLKPYLNVLVPKEKHNFDHQRTPNQKRSHEVISNSRLPKLSNVSKKITLIIRN